MSKSKHYVIVDGVEHELHSLEHALKHAAQFASGKIIDELGRTVAFIEGLGEDEAPVVEAAPAPVVEEAAPAPVVEEAPAPVVEEAPAPAPTEEAPAAPADAAPSSTEPTNP